MHVATPLVLIGVASAARAAGVFFSGGTIVAFDRETESLKVIRNGSLLVEDDLITGVFETAGAPADLPADTETVDVTGKILTPGFIDTHRHGWQTAFKTIGSNTSLAEYFLKYGEFVSGSVLNAEDVYIGQLAGLYEALNAGVTTTLDHAHSTWSDETAAAGLTASVDSGARVFYAYAFHTVEGYTVPQQLQNFEALAQNASFEGTPTTLCVAYDSFSTPSSASDTQSVIELIRRHNISVVTTHSLQGAWGVTNSPEDLFALGVLNTSTAVVFSHASFLTFQGATLLRQTDQFISITPESEAHYGHTDPISHLVQDQAALGVDTHFTFSTDILTQARLWLQTARYRLYAAVLDTWRIPPNNPMSVNQAFLLATRNGARALRRNDLGVIAVGAKADLVVWDGDSPALLGWVDPVAAVILHASVGDVQHVLVDGKFRKRDGKIVGDDYADIRQRFLQSARRIQQVFREMPPVTYGDVFFSGTSYGTAVTVDVQRGDGNGYGQTYA